MMTMLCGGIPQRPGSVCSARKSTGPREQWPDTSGKPTVRVRGCSVICVQTGGSRIRDIWMIIIDWCMELRKNKKNIKVTFCDLQ